MGTEPGSLSRREFLRTSGLVGGGVVLAPLMGACNSKENSKELSWLNWQDYIDHKTIPQFEDRTGIQVIYKTYKSNDELETKLTQARRPRRGGPKPALVRSDRPLGQLHRALHEIGSLGPPRPSRTIGSR